jgi:hypothetical protein
MAQSQTWTDTGIAELVKIGSGAAATPVNKIVCLNMATPCAAVVGSTFADPCDTATHHTDSGLQIVAIDTVAQAQQNTAGDSIDFDHVFTASATKNVAGIHVCNTDGDVSFIECCFNAVLAVENTDTITIDGRATINQA